MKPIEVTAGNVVVKIYRRAKTVRGEKYRVFEVADKTNGQRIMRSFSDQEKAEKEADRIAKALAAGEVRVAQMKAPEAASYGRAMQLLKPSGVALEIAAGHFAEAVKILGGDRVIEAAKFFMTHNPDTLTRKTVQEAADELVKAREGKGASDRYVQDLRARLTRFAKDFAVDISTVTTADVQCWFDKRNGSPQTLKNFRTVLGTLFKFAEARNYILRGTNPIPGTERVSGKNGNAVEIYTPEEIGKLLENVTTDFLPCIALGAFAGLRSAEIERLEWSNIDVAGGHIHVAAEKAKTASRRLVPITANLKAWLAPYARKKGKVWTGDHEGFYEAQQTTATAAGVAWKANALRHSFISYRLADVKNAAQVALEAGNSADVVFKHYREVVKPEAATAWFAVSPKQPANVTTMEAAHG